MKGRSIIEPLDSGRVYRTFPGGEAALSNHKGACCNSNIEERGDCLLISLNNGQKKPCRSFRWPLIPTEPPYYRRDGVLMYNPIRDWCICTEDYVPGDPLPKSAPDSIPSWNKYYFA